MMNKIKVVNDIITKQDIHSNIEIEFTEKNSLFNVNNITLKIKESCSIEIDYEAIEKTKLDLFIYVYENVDVNIFEMRCGKKTKVQYKYYIEENSHLEVSKFYTADKTRELSLIHLNGRNARVDYHLKTIARKKQKYDVVVYHNKKNTISNVYHHGVNLGSDELIFNVTGIISKGKKNCILNQQNRIITDVINKCKISPNLLIDENDVEANHAAYIGPFTSEELFYMMSRGISKSDSRILLTKGFLLGGLPINKMQQEKLTKEIEKVWR